MLSTFMISYVKFFRHKHLRKKGLESFMIQKIYHHYIYLLFTHVYSIILSFWFPNSPIFCLFYLSFLLLISPSFLYFLLQISCLLTFLLSFLNQIFLFLPMFLLTFLSLLPCVVDFRCPCFFASLLLFAFIDSFHSSLSFFIIMYFLIHRYHLSYHVLLYSSLSFLLSCASSLLYFHPSLSSTSSFTIIVPHCHVLLHSSLSS